jgi:diguanylate cyclase (GGDEF)-like protein
MTNMLDRSTFDRALPAALESVRSESKPLAVILIDVDHLASINDRYGEASGDAVLRHLCGVLEDAARKRDEIFRVGDDEFAVIAHDVPRASALCLAEAFCSAVQLAPARHEQAEIAATISAGIAWAAWPDSPASAEELLRVARARLGDAKRTGRNRCVIEEERPAVPGRPSWVRRIGRVFSHAAR